MVDIHNGFKKRLRSFLRKIVADAAGYKAVFVAR